MPLIPTKPNDQTGQPRAVTAPPKPAEKQMVFPLSDPKYTFDDMILSDNVMDELQTVVEAQRCWKTVFEEWGLGTVLRERKNLFINLYGASGTGKTMAAHAIAAALHQKLVCVNYADIESKFVGETSKNLTQLFSQPDTKGQIIFFDEADALLSKRVTDMSSATDVSVNQTRSVLLTLLNSYEGMVIFATNFISNYDSAFMRRIQYHIRFDLPNEELRERLWVHYLPAQMPVDTQTSELAKISDGLSGSDISTAVLKAALKAARLQHPVVTQSDFQEAVETIRKSQNANANQHERVTRVTEIVDESEVPEHIRNKANKKEIQEVIT